MKSFKYDSAKTGAQTGCSANDGWISKTPSRKNCQLLQTFTGHDRAILTVPFRLDSRQLAMPGADLTIKIWEIETGKLLQTLLGHVDRVNSICYSPDGKSLYSATGG
ncbi:hypothetical protein [Chamaesiphon sp. OTE_75_metabat_556]|uniref:WD40 repeat domain-containing protein n=1 Tax=Chamaesiphon sp. OTE_75_metabat_556 TaxID=2964692 RepID=UPI00286A1E57|nr:hypothetical protein [Chamaesiphon sp. OTE_75_metabat_556]